MRMANLSESNYVIKVLGMAVIVAIVGFSGYYVVHSKRVADNTLSSANTISAKSASVEQSAKKVSTVKPAVQPGQTSFSKVPSDLQAALVAYDQQKEPACVSGGTPVRQGVADDPAVRYVAGYAEVGMPTCDDGSATLFVKTNNSWQEVAQTQLAFSCTLLEQYKVPSSVVVAGTSARCVDASNNEVPYSQG